MAITDKQLDSIGAAQVRANLATNVYLGHDRGIAVAWMEGNDEMSVRCHLRTHAPQQIVCKDAPRAVWRG
jgi:hypothetical protein